MQVQVSVDWEVMVNLLRRWVIVGTAKVRTWEGKKTRCIREDAGTWIYLCISEAGRWNRDASGQSGSQE